MTTSTWAPGETRRASDARARSVGDLTQRELLVLRHMAEGRSNSGISHVMYLSEKTIETHIGSIFCKLGLYREDGNRRVLAVLAWLARVE